VDKRYSVADIRDHLTSLGSEKRTDFWSAYQDFLRRYPSSPEDEPDEWLAGARDPSPGRDFSW
jgi:hypothetical protein